MSDKEKKSNKSGEQPAEAGNSAASKKEKNNENKEKKSHQSSKDLAVQGKASDGKNQNENANDIKSEKPNGANAGGIKLARQPSGSKSKLGHGTSTSSVNPRKPNSKMSDKLPDMASKADQAEGMGSEQDPSIILADQQRDLVFNFCREFVEENGYVIRPDAGPGQPQMDDTGQPMTQDAQGSYPDYQDVTGEKLYISPEEVNEMESVIYSISFGKQTIDKRITYQAFSAAISSQMHLDLVLSFIARRQKIKEAKTFIVAYRLSKSATEQQKEELSVSQTNYPAHSKSQQSLQSNVSSAGIMEGYDDGNEEGCGEKLLSQLQKMGVENIMIVVYLWHHSMPGQHSQDIYRNVLERGKDLLSILHQKVLEAEQQMGQEQLIQKSKISQKNEMQALTAGGLDKVNSAESLVLYAKARRAQVGGTGNGMRNINNGVDIITKVYPADIIPDKKLLEQQRQRGVFRLNNFLNDPYFINQLGLGSAAADPSGGGGPAAVKGDTDDETADQDDDELEVELTQEEFNYAVKMTEVSIRQLTKQHVINLRKQVKPNHLVEKVLKMVCILRGCVAPNWTMARELMNSMTFKLELMLMDPTQIKPQLVRRVLRILNNNHKNLSPVNLVQIDQGASILLTWVINFIKWHTGCIKYNFTTQGQATLPGVEALSNQGGLLGNMDASITNNDDFLSHHQRIPGVQQLEDEEDVTDHGVKEQAEKESDGLAGKGMDSAEDRAAKQSSVRGKDANMASKSSNSLPRQAGTSRPRQGVKPTKSEREGNFVRSKQMQFGDDKKLQPSDISDLEKRGMITFAGRSAQIAPYLMDKSGQMIALGQKTRNQGTLFGERTSDGGDQNAAAGQVPPMLEYQDGTKAKEQASGPYTFQNQIVQQYQQANAGSGMYMMQGARPQEPPDIRDGAGPQTESPNMMGIPHNAMDGVYHDMKKQIEMGETSINNMMQAIANKDPQMHSTPGSGANMVHDPNWLRDNMHNEEMLLEFLDDPNNNLEDQPTDVLIALAQKLKERRTKHYQEMLTVQEEQDRKVKEEMEAGNQVLERKQQQLQEEMARAKQTSEMV